ncbi:hypothetical protein JCM6882_000636 [Rhodosporidiobolus microsporus]
MASKSPQELVDRLVVHTGETDVLYVLVVLREVDKKEGMNLSDAVLADHSWKKHSALVAAVLEDHTPVRRLILELLLLHVEHPTETLAYEVAKLKRYDWATELMETWATTGRKSATDAIYLSSCSLQDAGDWIDSYLPANPALSTLTGNDPIIVQSEADYKQLARQSAVPAAVASSSTSPSAFPQPPTTSPLDRPKSTYPSLVKPIRVHIGHLPLTATVPNLVSLLRQASIPTSTAHESKRHGSSRSFYATLPSREDYGRLSAALHGKPWPGALPGGKKTPPLIIVERNPPPASSSHPTVYVHGLPLAGSGAAADPLSALKKLARSTRTGAYGEVLEAVDESGACAIGAFRCPSPASAQDAVRELEGKVLEGGRSAGLRAEWRMGEVAPPPWERRAEKRRRGEGKERLDTGLVKAKEEEEEQAQGDWAEKGLEATARGKKVDAGGKGKGKARAVSPEPSPSPPPQQSPLLHPVARKPDAPAASGWAGDSDDDDDEEEEDLKPTVAAASPHHASVDENMIDLTLDSSSDEENDDAFTSSVRSAPHGPPSPPLPQPPQYKARYFQEMGERAARPSGSGRRAHEGRVEVVEEDGDQRERKRRRMLA